MVINHCIVRRALPCGRGRSRRHCLVDDVRPMAAQPTATAREATAEDAAAIAAFDGEYSVEKAREEIERGISRVHVAQDVSAQNEIVGWLAAWHVPPHELQIIQLTVSPAARRRGVGSMLLQTALDAHGSSVSQVVLEVREDNVAALRLYEKLGFARLGTVRKNYYSDGTDALCMILTTKA